MWQNLCMPLGECIRRWVSQQVQSGDSQSAWTALSGVEPSQPELMRARFRNVAELRRWTVKQLPGLKAQHRERVTTIGLMYKLSVP